MSTPGIQYIPVRGFGHPSTREANWDMMEIHADSAELLDQAIEASKRNLWKLWANWGNRAGYFRAWVVKPSGASSEWEFTKRQNPEGSDVHFAERRRQRIEVCGEIYVMCNQCGARLYSDDARPGEKQDRSIDCKNPKTC